jgi:hypothetical protein
MTKFENQGLGSRLGTQGDPLIGRDHEAYKSMHFIEAPTSPYISRLRRIPQTSHSTGLTVSHLGPR